MSERAVRETNEATFIRGYWVGGQRFRLSSGKTGWYVATFSGSDPFVDYWVTEGCFYKAFMRFVGARTFEIETFREAADIGSERKTIVLEAIRRWENVNQRCGIGDRRSQGSPLEIASPQ